MYHSFPDHRLANLVLISCNLVLPSFKERGSDNSVASTWPPSSPKDVCVLSILILGFHYFLLVLRMRI
jgi:hypothetical protein